MLQQCWTRTGASTSAAMDYLRQGIHLRGYAQKNPKQEYKREAFELFSAMLDRIKYDTVTPPPPPTGAWFGLAARARVEVRDPAEIEREGGRAARAAARAACTEVSAPWSSREPERPRRRAAGIRVPALARPARVGTRCAGAVRARRSQGRSQRTLSLRLRQKPQAVPREPLHGVVAAALACGAAADGRQELLIAQRPAGKWQAGRWEFPVARSKRARRPQPRVRRELAEELGVLRGATAAAADLPPRLRRPQRGDRAGLVPRFSGPKPRGLDGQALRWVAPADLVAATCSRRPTCP